MLRSIGAALILVAIAMPPGAHAQEESSGQPRATVPSGPAPRMPSGKPDLNGIWDHPYVPDMSRNGRGQKGYAEPPYTPADAPAARAALRAQGQPNELPFTP